MQRSWDITTKPTRLLSELYRALTTLTAVYSRETDTPGRAMVHILWRAWENRKLCVIR